MESGEWRVESGEWRAENDVREDVIADGADFVAHEAQRLDFASAAERRRPEEGTADVGHLQPRTDDVHVSDLTRRQR